MIQTIVIAYLVVTILVGLLLGRRVKSASDFLIAGRNLGLLLTTSSLAAVQIGAGVILGGSELGAASGVWPGMWFGIGCGGGLILAGILVAPKLRKRGGFVPLDFYSERFGEHRWIRVWAWLSNIPSLLGIFVAQILAAGSMMWVFDISGTQAILICGIVVMLYSVFGGMWSVAVINLMQVGIIVIGIPLVAVVACLHLHDAGAVSLGQVMGTPFVPSGMGTKAIFIIVPFLIAISVSYDAYMRYQSAKSEAVARWGCILGGLIVMAISFCAGLIGAVGRHLYPDVSDSEVLTQTVQTLLHPVVAGIVISALLAAALSTANCLLVSLAGTFTRDLYNMVLNPGSRLDELKGSKVLARSVIVGALVVGLVIAFRAKGILDTMIIFNYPYMGSLLVPLLGGVLWRGATRQGAWAAIIVGGIIGVTSFMVAAVPGPWKGLFNSDLGLLAAYAISAVVFVVVSLLTRPSETNEKGNACS